MNDVLRNTNASHFPSGWTFDNGAGFYSVASSSSTTYGYSSISLPPFRCVHYMPLETFNILGYSRQMSLKE